MPPPVIVTVPLVPSVFEVTVIVWPLSFAGPALSLAKTLIVVAPESSATVAESFMASGASFTALMVTSTSAALESTVPSLAV